MKALVCEGKAGIVDRPRPRPAPGEALIEVTLAGVCNTDLEIVKGYMGFSGILGHEFVGVARTGRWAGRRVVGEINCPCRSCPVCRDIDPRHCPRRTVLGIAGRDGVFCEAAVLPEDNLHAVPDSVGDEEAVFAEPLAAAAEIAEQVPLKATMRAAVVGAGKLGILTAGVLRARGLDPIVVGRAGRPTPGGKPSGYVPPASGAPAVLERPGFRYFPADEIVSQQAASFDLVVEASGASDGLTIALALTRPRGTLVLKSTYHGPACVDLAPIVIHEIAVIGSRCGPFSDAIDLLRTKAVDVKSLIEETYPLDRAMEALDHAARPGALKVLLRP